MLQKIVTRLLEKKQSNNGQTGRGGCDGPDIIIM